MSLKNRIKGYRAMSNLTQEELAAQCGVTRQTIISIEKGNYTPSVQLALKLGSILKHPVEELFYEESE